MVAVLDRLFPAETEKQATSAQRESKLLQLLDLYGYNDNNQFPEIRGTAYNLLNAALEYRDHYAPVKRTASRVGQTDSQIRAESAMFGTGADWKASALDIILEETAYNPTKRRVYSTPSGNGVVEIELEKNGSLLDAILEKGVSNKA